jgi:hypothetical protein
MLLDAGVTKTEIVDAVKTLLSGGTSIASLVTAGISETILLDAGVTKTEIVDAVKTLLSGGTSIASLVTAGVSISMLLTAGATATQLLTAGVSEANLTTGLLTNNETIENIYKIMNDNSIPKEKILLTLLSYPKPKVNIGSILTYGSYTKPELLALYTSTELHNFGYTWEELRIAGVDCFNKGTMIMCVLDNGEEVDVKVEELKVGMNVKSYLHGPKKIKILCKGKFKNDPSNVRSCMYKMKETGLTITGGHSILVEKLTLSEEKETREKWDIKHIDDKVLLMAAYSDKFDKQLDDQEYIFYHFCLENEGDELKRYGVYADGVLVETPAERCIKTFKCVTYL